MKAYWQKLKQGARVVGDFQARLILSLLYVLLVLPTGLILRMGGDLLESRYPDGTGSYWKPRTTDAGVRPARRQG